MISESQYTSQADASQVQATQANRFSEFSSRELTSEDPRAKSNFGAIYRKILHKHTGSGKTAQAGTIRYPTPHLVIKNSAEKVFEKRDTGPSKNFANKKAIRQATHQKSHSFNPLNISKLLSESRGNHSINMDQKTSSNRLNSSNLAEDRYFEDEDKSVDKTLDKFSKNVSRPQIPSLKIPLIKDILQKDVFSKQFPTSEGNNTNQQEELSNILKRGKSRTYHQNEKNISSNVDAELKKQKNSSVLARFLEEHSSWSEKNFRAPKKLNSGQKQPDQSSELSGHSKEASKSQIPELIKSNSKLKRALTSSKLTNGISNPAVGERLSLGLTRNFSTLGKNRFPHSAKNQHSKNILSNLHTQKDPQGFNRFATLRNTTNVPEIGDQILDKIIESLSKQKNELQIKNQKLEDSGKVKDAEILNLRKEAQLLKQEKIDLIESQKSQIDGLLMQHKQQGLQIEQQTCRMNEMQQMIENLSLENYLFRKSLQEQERRNNEIEDQVLQQELDNAVEDHYLEYAPSLQEIKEVESEMYLSERQNKDNGESLQNSQQSMGSHEGFTVKNLIEEGFNSPKNLVTKSSKQSLKDAVLKHELEKSITARLTLEFQNQISSLTSKLNDLTQSLAEKDKSILQLQHLSTKSQELHQLEVQSFQKLEMKCMELEVDLQLEKAMVKEMRKMLKMGQTIKLRPNEALGNLDPKQLVDLEYSNRVQDYSSSSRNPSIRQLGQSGFSHEVGERLINLSIPNFDEDNLEVDFDYGEERVTEDQKGSAQTEKDQDTSDGFLKLLTRDSDVTKNGLKSGPGIFEIHRKLDDITPIKKTELVENYGTVSSKFSTLFTSKRHREPLSNLPQFIGTHSAKKDVREFISHQDTDNLMVERHHDQPRMVDFDKALIQSPQEVEKYLDKVGLASSVEDQRSSRNSSLEIAIDHKRSPSHARDHNQTVSMNKNQFKSPNHYENTLNQMQDSHSPSKNEATFEKHAPYSRDTLEFKIEELQKALKKRDAYLKKLKLEKMENLKEINFLKSKEFAGNRGAQHDLHPPGDLLSYIEQGSQDLDELDFTKEEIDSDIKQPRSLSRTAEKIVNLKNQYRYSIS